MTGSQLMGCVKNEFPDVIRILFTGYADLKAVIDAVNSGGIFRYVTKPWDPDELIDLLREAAEAHGEILDRNRLFADLRDHVNRDKSVVDALRNQAEICENARLDADEFLNESERLLKRLADVIPEQSPANEGE